MEKIFVRPAREGLVVRHPEKLGYVLPMEGAWVVKNKHWLRMIAQGDLLVGEPVQPMVENKEEAEQKPVSKPKSNKEGGKQ